MVTMLQIYRTTRYLLVDVVLYTCNIVTFIIIIIIIIIIIGIQPLGRSGQRPELSDDWYGSGTLHPGQVLRGSLPLLSPAF